MASSQIRYNSGLESVLATNTILRQTYILLGLTLIFSAITAGIAMFTNAPLESFCYAYWIFWAIVFDQLFA